MRSFPILMKYSKIMSLYKSGDSFDSGNYKLISVLPSFSKIFDNIILNLLSIYLNINICFHSKQYGFTKGKSTIDAGAALLMRIYDARVVTKCHWNVL